MTAVLGFFVCCFLLIVVFWAAAQSNRDGSRHPEWETGQRAVERKQESPANSYRSLMDALRALRAHDPEFSWVLFEDFLCALYTEAHLARGHGRLEGLSPYLSSDARLTLGSLGAGEVRTVIIGSVHVERVVVGGLLAPTEVVAVFEANYAEVGGSGAEQGYYASERWVLQRAPGAKSRAPARARVIDCPNCGAPLDKLVGGTCGYCSKAVDGGEHDWKVQSIASLSREQRGPMLTGTVEEVGTSDPTIVAPDVRERWRMLVERDQALDWAQLTARLELVFRSFHKAWTEQRPLLVRPYLSDNLFQTQLYWIDAYQRQHLRNLTDGARIVGVHLCRIVSDAHYDAITVRVFATGLDYTLNEAGEVVGGSRDRERAYSEYWTVLRGVDRTGAARATPECPSCGAGLDVNMVGHCAHCNAKVTTGEFDWVLSRIEQDEVYG